MEITRYCYVLPVYYPTADANNETGQTQTQTCNKTAHTQLTTKWTLFYYKSVFTLLQIAAI